MNDKMIEEMLQHFDKGSDELNQALEAKDYATAASVQGYLIGVIQSVIIAYKNYGYREIPKEIVKRLDDIQSSVE